MNKFLKVALLILISTFLSLNLFAQNEPKQIDIRTLEIKKIGSHGVIQFTMTALDKNGELQEFNVADSSAITGIIGYTRCNPCRPPQIYSTNVFPNPISVQIGQTSNLIKFYLSDSSSSVLYLNQLFFSRKNRFNKRGKTKLEGRIEIITNGVGVTEVDEDVVLEGNWIIEFGKPYISSNGKKYTDFSSVKYILNDSRE